MADIPSFFNKPDFLGALLPGYIAAILGLAILFPEIDPIKKDLELQLTQAKSCGSQNWSASVISSTEPELSIL